MHYDSTLNGVFPNPIMVNRTTGASIGVNKEMSSIDIRKLNTMYPCKSTNPSCGKLRQEAYRVPILLFYVFREILKDLFST